MKQAMKKQVNGKQTSKKSAISGNIIALLLCVPFLLFGIAMIGVSISNISYKSTCTAETSGTVYDVSVDSEIARMSSNRKRYIKKTYMAHYAYEINGEELSDILMTSKRIENGQTITIRYDSDHPEIKYVKGYDDAGDLLPLIFGVVWDVIFLLIMCCIVIAGKNQSLKKQREVI